MLSMFSNPSSDAINITFCTPESLSDFKRTLPDFSQNWIATFNFEAKPETVIILPDETGAIQQVLWGLSDSAWQMAVLASKLPAGVYHIDDWQGMNPELGILTWALSHYQFNRYKKGSDQACPKLVVPHTLNIKWVETAYKAITLVRDLINTPAEDLMPRDLAAISQDLAKQFKADFSVVCGDSLQREYPSIYRVGRAATAEPLLIDLKWSHPNPQKKLVLVGKGVCFDSGGLDIKPSSGMLTMKKDMGGAAHVLGLARMIMAMNLPIDLRLLIPAVENAISGNAMRPMDVIKTRKGTTVEIGNTDAEGRLVLSDALYEASQSDPDLIIDFATLTGAARIALGTELPALFSNCNESAEGILAQGRDCDDQLWRMPLYQPYKKHLKSLVADLNNVGKSSYGGAITAALFLEQFVEKNCPWVHIDLMAWNVASLPGRPEGGEAMGLLAVYHYLTQWAN
ncbi:MAG: leucyl aminopeptidase family protein [Candidatus Paracaedibacteraceae bacterium]|nr:leucyl aminopeptidase family protein [Candidatus Paracaedibacteraceae bacterium]